MDQDGRARQGADQPGPHHPRGQQHRRRPGRLHPKAFDWQAAFPEVFAKGGFDVVVANPPYVRQELLSPIKPYLESAYRAYHGMADLYVYFYELGHPAAEARRAAVVTSSRTSG